MPAARRAKKPEDGERASTRRIVLERVRVLEVPASADPEQVGAAIAALMPAAPAVPPEDVVFEAWRERGEFDGTRTHAVERYAGKPGTPDAKTGVFKAPPARGFRGQVEYVQPPLPLVQRRVVP